MKIGIRAIGFFILTAPFVAMWIPDSASANDPAGNAGRLPDGRAYRIGADGQRLVDHIAELEVTVGELQQQIRTLEDETILQQQQIEEFSKTGQRTLPRAAEEPSIAKVDRPLPSAAGTPPITAASCSLYTAPLQQRVSQLESQAARASSAQKTMASGFDCEAVTLPYREQITALQNALMSGPSKEEYAKEIRAKQGLESGLNSRDEKLQQLSQELAASRNTLSNTQEQLKEQITHEGELKEQLVSLNAQLEEARESASSDRVQVASSRRPESEHRGRLAEPIAESLANENDQSSLHAARAEFSKTLVRIQSLVMKRKDRLDALKGRGKGVSVSLQPLVTETGASLDSLRLSVSKLNGSSDLAGTRAGLREIEQKLMDDIGVLQRLTT